MARRRLRAAAPSGGELPLDLPPTSTRRALVALGLFVAFLVLVGVGVQQLVLAGPGGALSACHTSGSTTRYRFADAQPMCIDKNRAYTASIVTTRGTITVRLDAKAAPVTVNNFVVLAVNHYYDGMRFWRIQDWVLQTGDPYGNGTWTPGYYLPEEGPISPAGGWRQGDLGMARPPNGFVNGAQFFILKLDWPAPGPGVTYNHFGKVTGGQPALQAIDSTDRILYIQIKVT
ncbi:MAG TPA: peptidylprolyl isomerase [Candidatus Dormibacteraeota bacterium]